MPTKRVPTQRTATHDSPILIFLIAGLIAAAILVAVVLSVTGNKTANTADLLMDADESATLTEQRVSFVAVGDNLPDDNIGYWADAQAGSTGDGDYNYESIYYPIKPYIENADVAYVDQETHIGGDEFGPRGYPSFNTTTQMADAIVNTGFDLVASATNHSYDWGYFGAVDYSRSVWNEKPVVFTGTASNAQEAAEIPVIERNGITIALLNYTYGVNGYDPSDLEPYEVNYIDPDRITADVTQAHSMADVVLVAMHWGTENYMAIDEFQAEYAQLLADLEVDVVLGSHPHVIGPLQWVTGVNGNKTLVAYSLGNFLSNHAYPEPENELEGMLTCDFVKSPEGDVSVENITWVPLINHKDNQGYAVYAVKDYTPELAQAHPVMSQFDDPFAWMRDTTRDVIGDEFVIDAG